MVDTNLIRLLDALRDFQGFLESLRNVESDMQAIDMIDDSITSVIDRVASKSIPGNVVMRWWRRRTLNLSQSFATLHRLRWEGAFDGLRNRDEIFERLSALGAQYERAVLGAN